MIHKEEWWFVALIALGVTLLSLLPLLAGYATQREGEMFMGIPVHVTDSNAHISFILQAKEGAWLFTNMFTGEDVPALLFNPFHLVLGKLSFLFGISPLASYTGSLVVLSLALFFVLYWFISLFTDNREQRRIALLLMGFSTGFGAWWVWLRDLTGWWYGSADTWVSEMNTFTSLGQPHFIASTILLLCLIGSALKALDGKKRFDAVIAGLFGLVLTTVHLFDIITAGVVLGTWFAYRQLVRRRWDWGEAAVMTIIFAIMLPALAYYAWLFLFNASYAEWNALNQTSTPNLIRVASGFGLVFFLAAFDLVHRHVLKKGWKDLSLRAFLSVWFFSQLLLIYLPFNVQRRFIMGLHIPLCLLSTFFVTGQVLPRLKASWKRTALVFGIILFSAITTIFLTTTRISGLHEAASSEFSNVKYLNDSQVEALAWLRENTQDSDVILAPYSLSNFIPAVSGNRVYCGHWAQTIDFEVKCARAQRVLEDGSGTAVIAADIVVSSKSFSEGTIMFSNGQISIYALG